MTELIQELIKNFQRKQCSSNNNDWSIDSYD